MAVQQITWAEINAYSAALPVGLSFWDKRLIRRLDDASEAARLGISAKPKTTDVAGMKASLRAVIAARDAKRKKEEVSPSPI